jgi:predicted DNA-binding transcriptional regulator
VPVTSAEPPLRQLTRLRTEMALASAERMAFELFPEDPMLAVEFGIVARICLPDWSRGAGLALPAAAERAIAVRQIALSLGGSAETTRRRVNQLIARGALSVSAQGISLAATAANEPLAMRYYRLEHDLLLRLIEDMAATCDLDIPVAREISFGAADVVGASIDVLLRPIDTFRPHGPLRPGLLLWGALTAVAVRKVTYDPVLSRRYAASIPPDAVREGMSVRRLAASLAIPYASAWRHMKALHAAGLVTRMGDDRWTVLTANLMEDSVRDIATPVSAFVLRKIRALGQMGLDPARAGDHYLDGRPPLADLGLARNG